MLRIKHQIEHNIIIDINFNITKLLILRNIPYWGNKKVILQLNSK